MNGKIKFYNPEKKFGFIIPESIKELSQLPNQEVYFNPYMLADLAKDSAHLLTAGRAVTFTLSIKETKKGINAMAVDLIPISK